MLCWHSLAGVAPGGVAQSRGDGVGSGSSRRKPSLTTRTLGLTGPLVRRAFLLWTSSAAGETLELRLWAINAKTAGPLLPGEPN
jgi:hypothetical protein